MNPAALREGRSLKTLQDFKSGISEKGIPLQARCGPEGGYDRGTKRG